MMIATLIHTGRRQRGRGRRGKTLIYRITGKLNILLLLYLQDGVDVVDEDVVDEDVDVDTDRDNKGVDAAQ